ncbi:MAG: hypothetical protein ABI592_10365 [Acidobacteriota bacterium]
MYEELARTVLLEDADGRLDAEIRKIVERHPEASPVDIAHHLVARAALRSAAVGAVASIPAGLLPGLPLAADLSFQVATLNRLGLGVARACRRKTTPLDRAAVAVGALALAGAASSFRSGFLRGARRSFSRRAPRLVPYAGALAGAISGALAAWAAGAIAERAFAGRRGRR